MTTISEFTILCMKTDIESKKHKTTSIKTAEKVAQATRERNFKALAEWERPLAETLIKMEAFFPEAYEEYVNLIKETNEKLGEIEHLYSDSELQEYATLLDQMQLGKYIF